MFKSPAFKRFLYKWVSRRVHKAYADCGCYFWIPCPNCQQYFGGHEIPSPAADIPVFNHSYTSGWMVCPLCTIQTGPTSAEVDRTRKKFTSVLEDR